jgi:hypothetical protein
MLVPMRANHESDDRQNRDRQTCQPQQASATSAAAMRKILRRIVVLSLPAVTVHSHRTLGRDISFRISRP